MGPERKPFLAKSGVILLSGVPETCPPPRGLLSSPRMRLLGVDFGERRIGVAVSDETGEIVLPAATLERKSDRQAASEISRMAREREVSGIVLGFPRREDGTEGKTAARVRSFAKKLEEETGLAVTFHDESGTTVEAHGRLADFGSVGRAGIDAVAAAVLLEDYLSERRSSGR